MTKSLQSYISSGDICSFIIRFVVTCRLHLNVSIGISLQKVIQKAFLDKALNEHNNTAFPISFAFVY